MCYTINVVEKPFSTFQTLKIVKERASKIDKSYLAWWSARKVRKKGTRILYFVKTFEETKKSQHIYEDVKKNKLNGIYLQFWEHHGNYKKKVI